MLKNTRFLFVLIILILLLSNSSFAKKKSAKIAMLLCLVPGGGQFYTERYIPGVAIGAGEITLGYYAIKNHFEKNYSERNSFLWWELFLFGYSLADAYVGAKMYGFDIETNIDKISIKYKLKL